MATEAAQEPNQEFVEACRPSPASEARVPPLSDDDIGWFDCEICEEPKLLLDLFPASAECAQHALCVACVVGHVEARVEKRDVPVRCPSCDGVMHPEHCKKMLYIGDFDAWCVALCELAVGGPSTFARCPNLDCGEMLDTGGEGEPPRPASEATCPRCSRAFCLRCEQPWDERHRDGEGCVLLGWLSDDDATRDAAAP